MRTNYHNLTFFEAAVVAMIFIGAGLIGSQIYLALPEQTQQAVVASVQIFDADGAWQKGWSVAAKTLSVAKNFQQEFYLAFSELAAVDVQIPPQVILAWNEFLEYSDYLAGNHASNQYAQYPVDAGGGGAVLGAILYRLE